MTQCNELCSELLQNGSPNNYNTSNTTNCDNDADSANSPAAGTKLVAAGRNFSNKKMPVSSPKCVPTTAENAIKRPPLFYDSKRRRVDKFYQKQSSLVEYFEQDSKQIQNYQQRRLNSNCSLDVRRTLSSDSRNFSAANFNDQHSVENGGEEPAQEFDDSTVSRLLEPPPLSLGVKNIGNGTISLPKVRIIRPAGSLRNCAAQHCPSPAMSETSSTSCNTESARASRRLTLLSLIVNLTLTVAKALASHLSGSLSIMSSLVDSIVDITSGFVIWLAGRAIRTPDPYLYPVGRTRLEPAALIIVSVIMALASLQMILKSFNSIVYNDINPQVDWPTIAIMVATVMVKLILFLLCRRVKNSSSSLVLAQDHRNDCLSNSIALLCAFGAQKFWLYLDPIGAIAVSVYIAVTWYNTGKEHLKKLSGLSAKPEFINRIIKVCIDHDPRIKFIDTVLVYHFGLRFLVEVHIGLDEHMSVKEAHDIAETLQNAIESMPDVERAFLHVDYEFEHKRGDEHKVP
ncbi:hypothetical protein niasHS_011494 [Heterodera schachtii]|uniref:Cation efflux protein cytoplasmic domain-containing protein n=1 Tax=Heterodera schachtii TaxID=97005 RepID=A0ABD2IFI9_HETSC